MLVSEVVLSFVKYLAFSVFPFKKKKKVTFQDSPPVAILFLTENKAERVLNTVKLLISIIIQIQEWLMLSAGSACEFMASFHREYS